MMKQSNIVNSKSPEECGSHGNSDDEFEEYSEEEMLSEEESNENLCMPPNKEGSIDKLSTVEGSCAEEPNEYGSSDEESAEEVPCGDESDDEDSCPEESNEENLDEEPEAASAESPTEGMTLEEASDEDPTDVSFEEIIEEEFYEELYEEPNGEEPLRGSMDQLPPVIISDGVSNLLEQKKASDHAFLESKTSVESCNQCPRESSNLSIDAIVSKQRDDPSASIKKRPSKWDIKAEAPMPVNESGDLVMKRKTRWSSDTKAEAPILVNDNADLKKRKTRWSSDETQLNMPCTLKLPDSVKDILSNTDNDQRIQRLNAEIQAINQMLGSSVIVNGQPQEESSPSPQPNDDGLDSRIYTSEFRHLVGLLKQKLAIISEITKSQKNDKPKHRSNQYIFNKKLYLPVKEYPNYNFIGLILGPNGNSLKKMEKETGATILLRGKGLSSKDKNNQCSDDDDEHVLIQSDSRTSFDAAVSMVEKLLVPVDDRLNYHKSAQLRELAELRGTLKEGLWDVKQCDICGKSSHQTSDCPLVATELQPNANFHTGSGSLFSTFKSSSASPCPLPFVANAFGDKPKEESKPVSLFVGHLSLSVSNDKLKELFLPYGNLCYVSVLMDKSTGQSKGCGFVRYTSASDAALAIAKMNGCMIDGKKLTVKIAEASPSSLFADLPNYPGFAAIPPPSLNTDLPNFPGLAFIPPPSSNANLPNFPGLAFIPPPSSTANLSNFIETPHPSSSNANLPKFLGFAPTSLPSNANLPNYPELSAFAEVIPKPNCWPGPPGSILPESGIYYPKSSYNSSNYTESVPLQSSTSFGSTFQTTSLGKNGRMMDGKVTATGTPSPSLNANLPNYPGFAAIPRDILESNCLSCPSGSIPPASDTFLSKSSYNLLKHTESMPFRSSTYLGSTCQTSISASQFPGVAATSNELATFPGFLKSFDPSNQLHQSMPSSSLSSPSPYFLGNFSSKQMNPTWREL